MEKEIYVYMTVFKIGRWNN